MSREWRFYLADMLVAIRKIRVYTAGFEKSGFLADSRTYDATVRNLEVLGEAAKRIPDGVRAQLPEIDFQRLAALRNVLSHVYFGIDDDILWDVIANRIPAMEAPIERYLVGSEGSRSAD